ncbi:MAG: methyltransferase domain-containing protein [Sneathiella sp.]|uniref:methyltransferase domain-containing protein n=1 Tax=Sneathiella sp. TaxID=1964365 RepID=UPI0030028978
MATDYEEFYLENRHGLGEPTKEFVTFFNSYDKKVARVLDVGCGQGRDSLFIARLGHLVTAVDQSPSGIRDLNLDANAETLAIAAETADIREHVWPGPFDVIVIDRTLHMLGAEERLTVLHALLVATAPQSHVLIADERSNIPAFKEVFEKSGWIWTPVLERRGFLFVQRT